MNSSNKRGALKCRILCIHLPSISSQEEKHIMSLSRCQVSPNCSFTAKHQAIPRIAWPGCYTLEMNLKKSLMHWLWGSTSGNGDVRRWCWGHPSPFSVFPWPSSPAELSEFLWGCRRGKDAHSIYDQLRRCHTHPDHIPDLRWKE